MLRAADGLDLVSGRDEDRPAAVVAGEVEVASDPGRGLGDDRLGVGASDRPLAPALVA